VLVIENIHKRFGGLQVIKGASFSIAEHEICGLIGPNGAGKTTLFNMISGLLHPDEGRITLLNEDITTAKPHIIANLGVGRTFQIVRPYQGLTVKENLLSGLMFAGKTTGVTNANHESDEILNFIGLTHKADILASDLTLSEKKSLEIAKALATKPRLLLLDECFAGLSPGDVSHMIALIKKIVRDKALTVLIVEHVLKAVMEVCQRVVVLAGGSIIANGSPEDVVNDEKVIEVYIGKKRGEGDA
jgi:branched-chain amino acid transport system ATP-binding protein